MTGDHVMRLSKKEGDSNDWQRLDVTCGLSPEGGRSLGGYYCLTGRPVSYSLGMQPAPRTSLSVCLSVLPTVCMPVHPLARSLVLESTSETFSQPELFQVLRTYDQRGVGGIGRAFSCWRSSRRGVVDSHGLCGLLPHGSRRACAAASVSNARWTFKASSLCMPTPYCGRSPRPRKCSPIIPLPHHHQISTTTTTTTTIQSSCESGC